MISVYGNKTDIGLTNRDIAQLSRYTSLIQWGRSNPVQFIEEIMQIPLLDYQKWLISRSWNCSYVVWVCSRNSGKSFLVSVFAQARALLYPKSKILIMSSGSRQANETFEKLENIATHNEKTLISDNTVFWDELYRNNADSNGFTHDRKKGSRCELLQGSWIQAVVGTEKTVRGKRSNVNIYDESGTITKSFFDATEPFVTQSSQFKTGSNYDPEVYPLEVPNIRLYVGSASDTDSQFYAKYREGVKQMLIGNEAYFVADINCDIPLHPTLNGKKVAPLLSEEEIERKRRENEIACNREYYNIFDNFNGQDTLISRQDIIQSELPFLPRASSETPACKYVLTYDPASKVDNSPICVTRIVYNKNGHISGKFFYMENLVITYNDGSKRPMRLDEQVKRIRELILQFNFTFVVKPYDNIMLLIDAGVGGQAPAIAQELCKEWVDSHGIKRPGLIDETSADMKRWAEAYPSAIEGHMRLIEPTKYRTEMFEAARKLIQMGDLTFPIKTPKSDTFLEKVSGGKEELVTIPRASRAAMLQFDLMKDELVAMVRTKTPSGKVTYGLAPAFANKMHDDRAYVAIMACWWINKLQQDEELGPSEGISNERFLTPKPLEITHKEVKPADAWSKVIGKGSGTVFDKGKINPFTKKNPFGRK